MTAFNIDQAFLRAFTMPKGRSQGSGATFEIKYVDAALDADAFAAEFFIEFGGTVWQHKLIKRLKALGAGSVNVATFANNDQNNSAAAGLVRVWAAAAKPNGTAYKRGACTPALLVAAHAKQQAENMSQEEFAAKTARGLEASLGRLGAQLNAGLTGTSAGLATVAEDVDRMVVEVGELRVTVASWDALTRENERLRAEVKHKTLLADRVEHSKGLITQEKNAHAARAAEAERRAAQLEGALAYERALAAGMLRENQDLRTQAADLRAQALTAHRLMAECTRMVERIGRVPMPTAAIE